MRSQTNKLIALLIVLPLLLFSCSNSKQSKDSSQNVKALADQYVYNHFRYHPEWGTFYGIEEADHSALTDNSLTGLKLEQNAEDSLMAKVSLIRVEELSKSDLITYRILKNALESAINTRVCNKHLWSMHQIDGFHTWFRYIGQTQPVGDSISRSQAIKRWKQIPRYIRTDMENNAVGLKTGYALPKVVIERVILQLDQLIGDSLESNPFYIPAIRDSSSQFKKEIGMIVMNEIMPEIAAYKEYLQNEYLDKAREELSITAIPNGSACYQASLSNYTTLSEPPETIFSWGEEAISLRERSIIEIGSEVYGETELTAIQAAFKADTSNYFSTKDEVMNAAKEAISRAKNKIHDFFSVLPKADVALEPIPELEEKSGSSMYAPASDDGSRPAKYVQQTYKPETMTKGNVESTAFHETYPGHHLQIAISRELINSHPILKYVGNSGFSEGWARYAESLAGEMDLYTSEKSKLTMLMRLPTGMVVDPGIHLKNWTRDEAIAYFMKKIVTNSREFAESYVDRIAVLPGQMTTYGVGEMYFLKLRERAERELASEFDIKEFHDECLQNGTVPLDFINTQVTEWIKLKTK